MTCLEWLQRAQDNCRATQILAVSAIASTAFVIVGFALLRSAVAAPGDTVADRIFGNEGSGACGVDPNRLCGPGLLRWTLLATSTSETLRRVRVR